MHVVLSSHGSDLMGKTMTLRLDYERFQGWL